jgi:CheY-like chemotaxis protein/anti-sigma regulatory factor (Ser/Thr protein kinase)
MTASNNCILLVDDCPEIVDSLASILAINNYIVDTACNGSEALRKLRKNMYDVVVCDIDMPGMNGLDFLERIRMDGRNQDVILMTGFLQQEYFIRAIRLGASDFISKPIDTNQLLKSIEAIIAKIISRDNVDKILSDLDQAQLSCVIDPLKFSGHGIAKMLSPFLHQNLRLSHDTLNELLICADEMLHNAFIHGVLELTPEQRQYDHAQMQEIIKARLNLPEIRTRRIRFSMSLDQYEDTICIVVEDDGAGFDYQAWLDRLSGMDLLSLDSWGRGLAMLYYLSDKLDFANGGRQVRVIRKINGNHLSGA